ncbi:hypothetical protein DAEQUDRAFT_586101 [Daedalea quercina L-15889]|uniref:Uncharacterized protein n=1 Tax=Daedalea quercina L-15889 TaxID=1314783 RepID=A0A165LR15_9APHY|nr:hypothetical protein DAEQUDRAFT_586101 [Daedalea quercina L-15889]
MKRMSLSLSEETPSCFAFPCKRARLHASIPNLSNADGQEESGFTAGRVLTSESVGRSWVSWKPRAPWYAMPPTCNGDDECGKETTIPGAEPTGRLIPASWHTVADAEDESDDDSMDEACETNPITTSLVTSSAPQGVGAPLENADHRKSASDDFATSSASAAESSPPEQQISPSEKPAHAISFELPPAEVVATPDSTASSPSPHTSPSIDHDTTHVESKSIALDSEPRAPPILGPDGPCSAGVSDRTNTQSPSPADIAASTHLHFHGASWEPQPCTRRAKLRPGERTAVRGFIWQCPLCHRQKAMSRDGLIKHL